MAQTDLPAISDQSKEMLNDYVKKGKPRKFFLIYKGATIKALVVFKKGPFGPKIMKAKKDGFKGDVARGVVTGSGVNLFFQLPGSGPAAEVMKTETWEQTPPTKRAKLREFLMDNDLNFKPSYYIIADAAQAPDPDSTAPVALPLPGSDRPEEEDHAERESAGAPQKADKKRLAATLSKLIPTVKGLLDSPTTDPQTKSQLQDALHSLKAAVKGDDSEQAQRVVARIVPLLQSLRAEQRQATSSGVTKKSPSPFVALQQSRLVWNAARKKIENDIRKYKSAVLQTGADEPPEFLAEVAQLIDGLDSVLGSHAEALEDALDRGLNAKQGSAEQNDGYERARQITAEYLTFVQSDPIVEYIDRNSFTKVAIASTLVVTLQQLSQTIIAIDK